VVAGTVNGVISVFDFITRRIIMTGLLVCYVSRRLLRKLFGRRRDEDW